MLIPLILSGGSGTRLWPVSREAYPKPFIKLPDGQSLLQKTLSRLQPLTPIDEVITVTNREHFFATRDEYRRSPVEVKHFFVLEPAARNTAPAVAVGALAALARHGPDVTLLVLPADHLVPDVEAFARADPPAPADLVGRPFSLTLRDRFGSALAVRGLVMAVERTLSALGAGGFVLTLGPAVEALTVGADCRVYQEQTPVSAVKDALARLEGVGAVQVFTGAFEKASIPPADFLQVLNYNRDGSDSLRAVFVIGHARNSFRPRCFVLN